MTKHDEILIKAEKRTLTGKKVNQLRRAGKLPGVIYGRHLETSLPIQMDAHEISLKMQKITSSSLVTLDVDGEKHNAIVRDRQRDVIYGRLTHLDFLAVSMTEMLRTAVGIVLVGEAPVLKTVDCVVNQGLNSLDIECLPQDLPERIEVDLSSIETVDDVITVADLHLDKAITVHTDPTEVVVSVTFAAAEAVEEVVSAEGEPLVVEKGKKEAEDAD